MTGRQRTGRIMQHRSPFTDLETSAERLTVQGDQRGGCGSRPELPVSLFHTASQARTPYGSYRSREEDDELCTLCIASYLIWSIKCPGICLNSQMYCSKKKCSKLGLKTVAMKYSIYLSFVLSGNWNFSCVVQEKDIKWLKVELNSAPNWRKKNTQKTCYTGLSMAYSDGQRGKVRVLLDTFWYNSKICLQNF